MTKEEIAELRALLLKATPAPWRDGANCIVAASTTTVEADDVVVSTAYSDRTLRQDRDNLSLIAAAHNALPALLDTAERLNNVQEAYKKLLEATGCEDGGQLQNKAIRAAALEAENAKLRELLEPFQKLAESAPELADDDDLAVPMRDIRRAVAPAAKGKLA